MDCGWGGGRSIAGCYTRACERENIDDTTLHVSVFLNRYMHSCRLLRLGWQQASSSRM